MNQSFSLLQEWGFITPHGLRQELWKFNFFLTTFHSTVERCPLWLCGVLAQIVVLRQAVSRCNFSMSSTFSFLCTSFFFFLILSPLLLCPSFLVWLWAVYLLFEIRGGICECYTETILWKYTAYVYVHSSMTMFGCSLLMFVLFDCCKTLHIWPDFEIFWRKREWWLPGCAKVFWVQ